ncbi:MAG TPA: Gfo/Idh/MocA family oxidoreductase [Victivallales bacterium]|nr:Gfo/Idh/MocA family oxidoreductase [Victivallales bacterium]
MKTETRKINWGILGTGTVANNFAEDLRILADAQILAVGSRNYASADIFARRHDIPRVYESYQSLVNDRDIDVVYIATPHIRHKKDCVLALNAGRNILCEKPFTINACEAQEVISLAKKNNLFCMEGMWMRFFPLIKKVKKIIENGTIVKVKMLKADFGVKSEFDINNRFYNPELGGGALLDRGIYPLSLAFLLMGSPIEIQSTASITNSGIDEQSSVTMKYLGDKIAVLSQSLSSFCSNEALIMGSEGSIKIHSYFFCPGKISLFSYYDYKTIEIEEPIIGNGYQYEAQEVMNSINLEYIESSIMPQNETLKIMKTLDVIREQWGLVYPQERQLNR